MPQDGTFGSGHFVPMDVDGGPDAVTTVEIGAEATDGRPGVLIAHDGMLALVVEGEGPALLGCSPGWLRGLAEAIREAADAIEQGAGNA